PSRAWCRRSATRPCCAAEARSALHLLQPVLLAHRVEAQRGPFLLGPLAAPVGAEEGDQLAVMVLPGVALVGLGEAVEGGAVLARDPAHHRPHGVLEAGRDAVLD